MECGSVSVRIGRAAHALGARRDGPLDTAHRGFRRAQGCGGRGSAVPDVQSCDVGPLPDYLGADHDPLYRFHQWQANLRVLNIREIETMPYITSGAPSPSHQISETQRDRLLNAAVGILLDMGGIGFQKPHRRRHEELAPLGFRAARFHRALPQEIELVFIQTAFQSQQQAIVTEARQ